MIKNFSHRAATSDNFLRALIREKTRSSSIIIDEANTSSVDPSTTDDQKKNLAHHSSSPRFAAKTLPQHGRIGCRAPPSTTTAFCIMGRAPDRSIMGPPAGAVRAEGGVQLRGCAKREGIFGGGKGDRKRCLL